MCQAWQSYGLWGLVVVTALVSLAVGAVCGYKTHGLAQWWKREKLYLLHSGQFFFSLMKVTAIIGVGGFVAWVWLFH